MSEQTTLDLTSSAVTSYTPYLLCVLGLMLTWLLFDMHVYAGRKWRLPPGPRGWPCFGNLLQLGSEPHVTLTALSRVYGDVYRLQLGRRMTIVLNGWHAVHQALVTQSDDFASRPNFSSFHQYADGKSLSFQPYNATYRLHRHYVARSVRAAIRADDYADVDVQRLVIREIRSLIYTWLSRSEPFDPAEDLALAIGGVLYSLCFGAGVDIRDDADYATLVVAPNPSTQLFGAGSHNDLLPWPFNAISQRTRHRQNRERMATFVALNSKKRRQHVQTHDATGPPRDVLDMLFRAGVKSPAIHDHLMSTTIEFISAGTDTSSTTLLWLVLYMACYPAEQQRAYHELTSCSAADDDDGVVDVLKAPFTEACVFEVMRLVAIVPFALPHASTRHTKLSGYDIPNNTLVLVNLWSVARDERMWPQADKFKPDRFLYVDSKTGRLKVDRQKVHRFLPFGAGRRRCVGERLGQTQVFLIFSALLKRCHIKVPAAEPTPKLAPLFGDVMKPHPYKVLITER